MAPCGKLKRSLRPPSKQSTRTQLCPAFKLQSYLRFARKQVVTLGAPYSLELLHEGAVVSYVLPEAFKNGANVIANCELVIKLAGGSGMLNI